MESFQNWSVTTWNMSTTTYFWNLKPYIPQNKLFKKMRTKYEDVSTVSFKVMKQNRRIQQKNCNFIRNYVEILTLACLIDHNFSRLCAMFMKLSVKYINYHFVVHNKYQALTWRALGRQPCKPDDYTKKLENFQSSLKQRGRCQQQLIFETLNLIYLKTYYLERCVQNLKMFPRLV